MTKLSLEEMVKEVDAQLERGNTFIELNMKYQNRIFDLWTRIRGEVLEGEPSDELQQACVEMMKLWEGKHKRADGLEWSDIRTHTIMSQISRVIGINEGGKCPPWDPQC